MAGFLKDLKAWSFHSLTIAWGYTKIFLGMVLLLLHEIASIVGDITTNEEVKAIFNTMNFPAYIGLGLAILGIITISARMRTVRKATDSQNQIIEIEK